jgi:hypothetical protein
MLFAVVLLRMQQETAKLICNMYIWLHFFLSHRHTAFLEEDSKLIHWYYDTSTCSEGQEVCIKLVIHWVPGVVFLG